MAGCISEQAQPTYTQKYRWGKKDIVLWVYVHAMICRCVGFRLFWARTGSDIGYAISLVWYPRGLATLSQMTWWQSCKANKETSTDKQSFFSASGAKNMTKPYNGVVWKQWTREKVLGFNLNENQVTLIAQVQTAPSLFVAISGGPWFLQLWSWSWKQQRYQENQNDTQVAWGKISLLSRTEKRNGKRRKRIFWETFFEGKKNLHRFLKNDTLANSLPTISLPPTHFKYSQPI